MIFQSTLPRRERLIVIIKAHLSPLFQSTLPRRERPRRGRSGGHGVYFNPRSHEGSDDKFRTVFLCSKLFQSTLPRRERQISSYYNYNIFQFQSTLPRRERPDDTLFMQYPWFKISIHAPTKGATSFLPSWTFLLIFQSTLPRRERRRMSLVSWLIYHFNPRSHEGSDYSDMFSIVNTTISIHAPTKGATK